MQVHVVDRDPGGNAAGVGPTPAGEHPPRNGQAGVGAQRVDHTIDGTGDPRGFTRQWRDVECDAKRGIHDR